MEAAALEKDWVLGSENAVNVHRKWAWVREKTHEYASEKEDSRINQRSFGKMRATARVAPHNVRKDVHFASTVRIGRRRAVGSPFYRKGRKLCMYLRLGAG